MRNRLFAALSGLMILSMLLSACAPAATPVPPTSAPAAPAPAQPTQPPPPTKAPEPTKPPAPTATPKPKVIRITLSQEPDALNPMYTQMWFTAIVLQTNLATGLLVYNDKNEPIPWIAKEIPSKENGGLSADGKILTFKLRDDVKWSDGEPLTAEDYVFTWKMIMDDKNKVQSRDPFDTYVDNVEAKDKTTLVVTFNESYAPWPSKIFSPYNQTQAIPKHILEPVFQKDGTLDNAEYNRKPTVGAGPFVFKEWQSGSHLIFVANPSFWLGKPKVDQIFFKIVPDDAAQIAAIKTGDTDIGTFISASDVPELQKIDTIDVVREQSGYRESWFFNLSNRKDKTKGHPALQDVNVRKAIVMAVDRDKIVKEFSLAPPPVTFWDGTPYGNPDLKPIPYDPEGAKKLLDDAGWKVGADGIRAKGGVKLKLRYITTDKEIRKNTQVVVQQMLKAVGIDTVLINNTGDVIWATYDQGGPVATGQYDIAEWSDGAFPDPDTAYWLCKEIPSDENPAGVNQWFICDEELDKLFTQQATADTKTRIDLFHQIGKLMYDKVYWISLWDDQDLWTVSKKLQNVRFSGATPFWNCYEWDIK
jgi:peptide/nickel transport system substrate-binding protein